MRGNHTRGPDRRGGRKRQAFCCRGHRLEGDNVYWHPDKAGGVVRRDCRACCRARKERRTMTVDPNANGRQAAAPPAGDALLFRTGWAAERDRRGQPCVQVLAFSGPPESPACGGSFTLSLGAWQRLRRLLLDAGAAEDGGDLRLPGRPRPEGGVPC